MRGAIFLLAVLSLLLGAAHQLRAGEWELSGFAGAEVRETKDLSTRLAGHLAWRGLTELSRVLQRQGVGFGLMENTEVSAALVSRYLNIKRRQIL